VVVPFASAVLDFLCWAVCASERRTLEQPDQLPHLPLPALLEPAHDSDLVSDGEQVKSDSCGV
jgi:hypothetical protein